MNKEEFRYALNVTSPTIFAYTPMGFVFGLLFTDAGYQWHLAPLMSALVYAGAVQFVALSMMMNHSTLLAIISATMFVALRNSFYGLALIDRFKQAPVLKRWFMIFGLVDASYAILSIVPKRNDDVAFCFYVTLFPYISWVGGTFLGAFLADYIPDIRGMDFVLTSFFAILVIEYYLMYKKIDALIVPIPAAFLAYWFVPQYYLILAIILCVFYLYIKLRVTHE